MAELPAWSGVAGDAMTSAATAYLKALREPTAEQDREAIARKARSEESDIALKQAHALYYGRPEKSGARPIKVGNKVVWVGPDGAEVLFEGPDVTKPDDFLKESALQGAEELLGKSRHLWNADDKLKLTTDPRLIKMMDVFKARPDLVSTPAGAVPRDTARAGDVPASQAVKPPGTATPSAPPGDSGGPVQPVSPAPAPRAGTASANEQAVLVRLPAFEAMNDTDLEPTLAGLKKRQQRSPSPSTLADIEAAERVMARRREQKTTQSGTPPSVPADQPGTSVPGQPAAPKTASATPPAAETKGFQPYRSAVQKEEDARKRAGDEREQARLRLQQQGLSLQEQEARLRELDRQEDNRRADAQLALSQTRTNAYLKELEDANKRKDEAAAFRVTQNVMRETREARGMIQGVDETVALIQEMRRYISPETVGVKGAVRGAWQSVWGQLTDSAATKPLQGNAQAVQRIAMETAGRHAQEAEQFGGTWQLEENERARAEGRAPNKIYIPDYSKYGYDPRMRFIDFLKEVIAYAHARAMNGPGRLTDQDLNRAQKSLGIDGWINSAADMQTSIGYVEQQLKAKKARAQAYAASVEKTLRKHRPGAVEAGGEDVTPPPEE